MLRIKLNPALFVFAVLLFFTPSVFALVIEGIDVKGNRRIESTTILAYLPLSVGDTYNKAVADRALKTLFGTGLFSDVKIRQNKTRLLVQVSENPIVNQVSFEGNSALDADALTPLINIQERSVYSRALVLAAAQTIAQQYRRQGYYRVRVEPKIIQLKFQRVNVVFEISEGQKSFIKEIYFLGNETYSDSDLLGGIASTRSSWWKFLLATDTYDPDRLEFDKQLLRSFYTRRGFADFSVRAVLAERDPKSDGFYITFVVDEGKRYRFGKDIFRIEIPGVDKDEFLSLLEYSEGDVFDGYRIGKSRDAIVAKAQTLGYAFIDVRPDLEKNKDTQRANVVWRIAEAPRTYVEKININGNSHTEDEVIRREFRLAEGDAFNRVLLDQSDRALKGLGFFDNVTIEPRQGASADKVILDTTVAERPTGEISLGLGYSTADGFIGDFGIKETNFQGKGQTLDANFSYAQRRQSVRLSFSEPYFLGKRLRLGASTYFSSSNLSASRRDYDKDELGASVSLQFPLREDLYLSFIYDIRNDRVFNSGGFLREGNTLQSSLGYRLIYDRRDDIQKPSNGWFLSLGQDFAGLGGEARYMRSTWDVRVYKTLAESPAGKYIFASRLLGGHLYPLGGYEPRTLNNFFLGSGNFRGFERSGLGPRRGNGVAVGGRLYSVFSNELRVSSGFLNQVGLTPVIFLDTAIIGDAGKDTRAGDPTIQDNFGVRISAGFSLLWESPLGPLRFDFADVLLREGYDRERNFQFQIGVTF